METATAAATARTTIRTAEVAPVLLKESSKCVPMSAARPLFVEGIWRHLESDAAATTADLLLLQ